MSRPRPTRTPTTAGANLIDAATKAGACGRTTAPVAANGADQGGQPARPDRRTP